MTQLEIVQQLFETVLERLTRIELKLDTRASVEAVSRLEERIRALEVERIVPRLVLLEEEEKELRDSVLNLETEAKKEGAVEAFRLTKRQAYFAAAGVVASLLVGIWTIIHRAI